MRLRRQRSGFTLVELLVAIGIIIAFAAITLTLVPKFQDKQAAARGADQLQGWLSTARSRAVRDQLPRGVRLIIDSDGFVKEAQYIEAPEPLAFPGTTLRFSQPANVTSPCTATLSAAASGVVAGDYLEITYGGGSTHLITGVSGGTITLNSSPASAVKMSAAAPPLTLSDGFRFHRKAQPLMGEPILQLPNRVVVNPSSCDPAIPTAGGSYDLLFSPSGQLANSARGRVVLWVQDDSGSANPTLITIYTRTGAIASHPVDTVGSDKYSYTRDGRSSGL